MKRTLTGLVACVVIMSGNLVANAALIDFTFPGNSGLIGAPVPSTYQPLGPADTITYGNGTYGPVNLYNGANDHTSNTSGGDNYFTYPGNGNNNTEVFSFSAPVTVNSFWYALFHDSAGGTVVASIYSNTTATGTPLDTAVLPVAFNGSGAPDWASSGSVFAAFNNVQSITFTNGSSNDAVNIDDISVTPVPEPSALVALVGVGAMGLFFAARRRKHKAG